MECKNYRGISLLCMEVLIERVCEMTEILIGEKECGASMVEGEGDV